jgi:uncharacterized protein YhaN
MKFLELHLRAVGPFTDYSLDLAGGDKGLHILYGPNEAGKSSALRALPYLFFGFPKHVDDGFLHPYSSLRVGARISNDQNEELAFLRRKALKSSLRELDDTTVIPDETLRRFLGQIDQGLFTTFFGIDHPTLVQGGLEIVRGQGDIGKILFSGSGVSELHAVLKQLDVDMQALFSPSGRAKNPHLNDLLGKLEAVRRTVREKQLPHRDWDEQRKALERDLKRKEKADEELSQFSAERNRLDRVQQALPLIASRADLVSRRAELIDVPALSADFRERRQAIEERLRLAEAECTRASSALKALKEQSDGLEVPESFLDEGAAIEPMSQRLGVYQQARDDRPTIEAELQTLEADALETLHKIDQTLDLANASTVEIPEAQRTRIRTLGNQFDGLTQQVHHWTERVSVLKTHFGRAEKRLGMVPKEQDSTALRLAVQQAMKLGDIEDQLVSRREDYRSAEEQLGIDLKQLPLWQGTPAELEALATPTVQTIERLDGGLAAIDQELRDLCREKGQCEETTEDLDGKIRQLRLELDVPTEGELSQYRGRRQQAWSLIRRRWLDGEALDEEIRAFLESPDESDPKLAAEFERTAERADDIADRLRREASRVSTLAEYQAQRKTAEDRAGRLAQRIADAEERRGAVAAEWTNLWQPPCITPLLPREMLSWTRRQLELKTAAANVRQLHNEVRRLEGRVTEHAAKIRTNVEALMEQAPGPDLSLADLIDVANGLIESIAGAASSRQECNRDLERLADELEGAQESAAKARQNMDAWQAQWKVATDGLPLKADHGPAEATVLLDSIGMLSQRLRGAQTARTRIGQIDSSIAQFAQYVSDLTARLAPDLESLAVEQAAAELSARYQKAITASGQRDVITKQIDKESGNVQKATTTIESTRLDLSALCIEAGCASAEELPEIEVKSKQKHDADAEIKGLETQLRRLSGGQTVDEFVSYAQTIDADTIEPRIRQLNEEIDQRNRELKDELGERIGATKKVLEQMDSSAAAAEAAEDAQDLAARIASDAEEYARLKIASVVLVKAIERFRDAHQGPILQRASQLFADLTVGSFVGLREDFDENGKPELFGIRAGSNEAIRVKHMSDGCADQLYLAVRLAWLENYLSEHETIPFIVDDILIRFDDDRAVATLKVLAELSKRTQVLFFTHHRHLIDRARDVLDEATLFVHELSRNALRSGEAPQRVA